jgi:hypothetical protein
MRYMDRKLLAVLLGAAIAFVSCSQPKSMQNVANIGASPLKKRIPHPDANKYDCIRDARDGQKPYLMANRNGIDARPISAATEAATMSPTEVVAYLEKLPSIAWPYGLVVAAQENGLRCSRGPCPYQKKQGRIDTPAGKSRIKVDL